MVCLMHWTAISLFAACACGSVIPRAPDVSLASLIRNSNEVQRHMKSILGAVNDALPYSEGPLQDSKSVKLDGVSEDERECMYLRNTIKPQGFQAVIDINPHADYPDQVTGDESTALEITTSLAKIDSERIGWNKEVSTEIGASATLEASAGFGPLSASLSTTVYGNQRTTGGQNGESATQTEFRNDMKVTKTCPKKSICRVATWTYTRTIVGSCFLTPYYDAKCVGGDKGKYSLGLFPTCEPAASVASQFFDFNYAGAKASSGFGPDSQGITMHRPEVIRATRYEENCTFSYVLRMENGDPVRAQALIIETDSQPEAKKSEVKQVPKAYKWVADEDGDRSCNLEKGWSWQPGDFYYIPKSDGGSGNWEHRPDLPKPEGLDEKCPQDDSKLSARDEPEAEAEAEPEAGSNKAPPKNTLVKVEMITDDIPKFVASLGKSKNEEKDKNEDFAANLLDDTQNVDESEPIVVDIDRKASAKECLSKLKLSSRYS